MKTKRKPKEKPECGPCWQINFKTGKTKQFQCVLPRGHKPRLHMFVNKGITRADAIAEWGKYVKANGGGA